MNTEDDSARESMMLSEDQARGAFLKKSVRFAVVTPPAITLLLGTSLDSRAIAKSSGGGKGKSLSGDPRPGNGLGDQNHVHTGPPGQK